MEEKLNIQEAQSEIVAVWYPKFTLRQVVATLHVLGGDSEIGSKISKNDFVKAATHGHLKIEKIVRPAEHLSSKKSPVLPYIHVSVGVLGYKNLGRYNDHQKNKDLFGVRIFTLTEDVIKNNPRGVTYVSWFQKMLGLVFIKLKIKKRHTR